MGAADLEDVLERLRFVFQRLIQAGKSRVQPVGDLLGRGDMHGCGERVVGRLAEIDMIVGVDRALRANGAAEHFARAVGDHLVQIHVGLGAGAGLPHDQREMAIERAGDHLVGRRGDRLRQALVDQAEFEIGQCCSFLDHGHGPDQGLRHGLVADFEVPPRALGLGAPVAVARNFDRSERIGLGAR